MKTRLAFRLFLPSLLIAAALLPSTTAESSTPHFSTSISLSSRKTEMNVPMLTAPGRPSAIVHTHSG